MCGGLPCLDFKAAGFIRRELPRLDSNPVDRILNHLRAQSRLFGIGNCAGPSPAEGVNARIDHETAAQNDPALHGRETVFVDGEFFAETFRVVCPAFDIGVV